MGTGRPGQNVELQVRLRTDLRALPGVLQTLGMLAMSHAEVTEATERGLSENPVLERSNGHPCPGCGRHVSGGYCRRCRQRSFAGHAGGGTGTGAERGTDPFRTLESEAGAEVRPDCRRALSLVAAHLTNRGVLDTKADEIAALHGLAADQVDEALRALRAVGPAGIGAESVIELLAVQAEVLVQDHQAAPWLPDLVRCHLADLAQGDANVAAKAMNLSTDEVLGGLAIIRTRLRPFAVAETSAAETPEPGADVFLYRLPDGSLEVEVPDSSWFGLRVVDLAAGLGDAREARDWLAAHELAARQLIRQVDGRANVLLRVTRCAAARQNGFLEHGPGLHRPLTRTEVAEELGIHPSTVSRSVRGKRLRLPRGDIVDLACLFGKGVAAKSALLELLAEAGGCSDDDLRRKLSERGFRIARRTVTKYRHSLVQDSLFQNAAASRPR